MPHHLVLLAAQGIVWTGGGECLIQSLLMNSLLHCSWPGQAEWWCETLQLHSKKLFCQFKGGTEADKCSILPSLPPRPALWRKLWLWDFELEILHMCVRENSEKISWGIFTLFLFFGTSFVYLLLMWIPKAFLRPMCAAMLFIMLHLQCEDEQKLLIVVNI